MGVVQGWVATAARVATVVAVMAVVVMVTEAKVMEAEDMAGGHWEAAEMAVVLSVAAATEVEGREAAVMDKAGMAVDWAAVATAAAGETAMVAMVDTMVEATVVAMAEATEEAKDCTCPVSPGHHQHTRSPLPLCTSSCSRRRSPRCRHHTAQAHQS